MTEIINYEIAANVLSFFGEGGYSGGSYRETILTAASKADWNNIQLLALGYPALIAAFRLAKSGENGIKTLTDIMNSKS